MNRLKCPVIAWGAGFANLLRLGYPLDNVNTGSAPREGHETASSPSGIRDAWDAGEDQRLEGEARWIPLADTAAPVATGWEGATGWKAFLSYAAVGQQLVRFYPSYADYLVAAGMVECSVLEPTRPMADSLETDATRRLRLVLSNAATEFTGY